MRYVLMFLVVCWPLWLAGCGHYERYGITTDQAVPELTVHQLDGREVSLSSLWRNRPVLLVSASLTCPIARRSCRGLPPLVDRYRDRLDVVILYTIEAHPKGDPSPYGDGEWVTIDNYLNHILFRQPQTLQERIGLAKRFAQRFGDSRPAIVVDDMDDRVWKSLGRGPNMALLIDTHGVVQAKQGWLKPSGITRSIDALLSKTAAP